MRLGYPDALQDSMRVAAGVWAGAGLGVFQSDHQENHNGPLQGCHLPARAWIFLAVWTQWRSPNIRRIYAPSVPVSNGLAQ